MKTIMFDPGHGGSDPVTTYKGNEEKNFNLLTALVVRDYLVSKPALWLLKESAE